MSEEQSTTGITHNKAKAAKYKNENTEQSDMANLGNAQIVSDVSDKKETLH